MLLDNLVYGASLAASLLLGLIQHPSGALAVPLGSHLQLEGALLVERVRKNVEMACFISSSGAHDLRHYMRMRLGEGVWIS